MVLYFFFEKKQFSLHTNNISYILYFTHDIDAQVHYDNTNID